ncbi:hypothetical protein [Microbacterium rhizophilus]|uniref:hypothetical protein n=1 Tax=Microbacterium rhizophilus TaxID=3138934 RepID=UPI0031EE5531
MLTALAEYEAGLNSHGIPLDEATSPDGDPNNPAASFHWEARVVRDFSIDAIEQREKDFKDDPSRARIFTAVRVDH